MTWIYLNVNVGKYRNLFIKIQIYRNYADTVNLKHKMAFNKIQCLYKIEMKTYNKLGKKRKANEKSQILKLTSDNFEIMF